MTDQRATDHPEHGAAGQPGHAVAWLAFAVGPALPDAVLPLGRRDCLELAHAVLAICYAHSAELESPQKKIAYSKLVRAESEKSLQLDPRQDIALHVLGAWNYSMATLNPFLKSVAEMVYGKLPSASLKSSADYFHRASQVAPARVMHKAALAKTYAAMGEKEKALKALTAAEALRTEDKEDSKILGEARLAVKTP